MSRTEQMKATKKEVDNLIRSGCEYLDLKEYESILLNKFGLKLDLDIKSHLLKYFNTSNEQHYLCATTSAVDKTGYSWANVNGEFYKKHVQLKSALYSELKEFRNTYFTTLKTGHILYL